MTERALLDEELGAYLDDALPAARRAEVASLLQRHPDLARQVQLYEGDVVALREALEPIALEPVPDRLQPERLIAALATPRSRVAVSRPWLLAASLMPALLIGGAGGWLLRGPPPALHGIAALDREAAESYRVYANDPDRRVELGPGSEAQLAAWISRRLHRSIAVPDLDALGYRFLGGRLVSTPNGPAGLFLYSSMHDASRGFASPPLAILIRAMTVDRDAAPAEHRDGTLIGLSWADRGIGYSLVSAANHILLQSVAHDVRQQLSPDRD